MAEETPPGAEAGDFDGPAAEINLKLKEASHLLYGDKAELRVVDPSTIRLLAKNARFMKKPTFDQLTQNVASDKMLSSVPLCEEHEDGSLEVVSGNHRIKAAIASGLKEVLVLVVKFRDNNTRVARQLSHNAITGEDDQQLLAGLWKELDNLNARLYSGLDSETVAQLEKLNFMGFTAEQVRAEQITLWFLPEEVEDTQKLLEQCAELGARKDLYLAPLAKYETLWKSLVKVKKLCNIKNTALAFMVLIDLIRDNLDLEDLLQAPPAQEATGLEAVESNLSGELTTTSSL